MIKQTAPQTYTATIAGTEWQNITPASYLWDEVQERIADGEEVIDMTGPRPEPIPHQMTFAQLLIGLVGEGWITEAEGEAWLEGRIPAAAEALIATFPEDHRFAARARASRPSTVLRTDPLVIALASSQGRADDLDRFFTTYAVI
ncbi:MAG: hypothetical protein ACU0CT_03525 [Paracoccaceae bacterium]